jgi:multidrug efflux pump subunit AcrB
MCATRAWRVWADGEAGGAGNGTAARAAVANAKPSVIVMLFRQPGANIIDTVDSVKAAMPELVAALPSDIQVTIANDRTTTIRAALPTPSSRCCWRCCW